MVSFAADLGGNVNSYRQNVQIEYVAMLQAAMESGDYGHNIAAAIYAQLSYLSQSLAAKISAPGYAGLDNATQAHTNFWISTCAERWRWKSSGQSAQFTSQG